MNWAASSKRLIVACASIAALGGVLALLPVATVHLVAASSEPAEARGGGGGAGGAGAGGSGNAGTLVGGWSGFGQGTWMPWQPRGMGYGYGMATVASIPVPTARSVHRQTASAVKKHRTAVAHHQAKPLSLQDLAAR